MPLHPIFLPAGLLFTAHQLLQKVGQVSLPLADQYLDPLLCMPILLGIWQWEQAWLFKRQVSTLEIWTLVLALVVLFEVGFPAFSPAFTADWGDVVLYFAGAGLFVWRR